MAEQQHRRAVLTPVASPTSVDHAVSQLRDAIVTGGMRPGERLVETELAERLGLSRGPIREALHQLAREGLVTIHPNRGAVVSAVHAEDVVEVYALRATLGAMALRNLMGTNRSTPEVAEGRATRGTLPGEPERPAKAGRGRSRVPVAHRRLVGPAQGGTPVR